MTDFDVNAALSCCIISALAYETREYAESLIRNLWKWRCFDFIDNGKVQVIVASKGNIIVIGVRGVDPFNTFASMEPARSNLRTVCTNKQRVKVHAGFLDDIELAREGEICIWDNIVDSVKAQLQICRESHVKGDVRIFVTGHGCGGSLATLIAWKMVKCRFLEANMNDNESLSMSNHHPPPVSMCVYTFGAPKVGNQEFCDDFNECVRSFRIVHTRDYVHSMPFNMTWYKHVGVEVKIRPDRTLLVSSSKTRMYTESDESEMGQEHIQPRRKLDNETFASMVSRVLLTPVGLHAHLCCEYMRSLYVCATSKSPLTAKPDRKSVV